MNTVILICAILAGASALECNSPFKLYLNCISNATGDSVNGKIFEEEFDQEFVKHVADCYDESDLNGENKKCILSKANLDTDVFGPDGPLKFCEKCRQYAIEIRDHIFDASDSKSCFRDKFSAAIVKVLQPCIRAELNDPNLNVSTFPDFDKNSKDFMDLVLKTISHRVMAYSRLAACKLRFLSRAQVTTSCMNNTKGLYPKLCDLSKSCKTSFVTSDCRDTFDKTKNATCKCLNIQRDELHRRLENIHDAVFNSEHNATVCSVGVKAAYGHWVQDIEDIFETCARSGSKFPNIPITNLIDAGCFQAADYESDKTKLAELNTGFRFIRFVLDALTDKATRFCSISCS